MAGKLPVWLTSFVGRDEDLDRIRRLLGEGRLVTLTGPGGCGKTRLAVEAARALQDDYPDGVWFADLGELTDDGLIVAAIRSAAGLVAVPSPDVEGLVGSLRELNALLVLDNCEHLVEESAEVSEALVLGCENLRVLATSREPLGVEGEWVIRIGPLTPSESMGLFEDRARHADSGFQVVKANVEAVEAICRRLDGLPLALELAAARVGAMTPALILERLDERFRLLIGRSRSAVARHRTLSAAIEWSEDLLSPAERLLFQRLGVFAGGFELQAAENVVAGPDLPREEVLPLLRRLVERSMVQQEQVGTARYRLLETLREHALNRLVATGEVEALRNAHDAHFAGIAWRAFETWRGLSGRVDDAGLERDLADFRAALDHTSATGSSVFPRLAVALWPVWHLRVKYDEGRRWMQAALATSPADPTVRYSLLFNLGWLEIRVGDLDAGRMYAIEALVHAEERSDTLDTAAALNLLMYVENMSGDLDTSKRYGERAVELARQCGNAGVLSIALNNLAYAMMRTDHPESALVLAQEAVSIARQRGNTMLNGLFDTLAQVHMHLGEVDAAVALQREGLRQDLDAGTQVGSLATMAALMIVRGQPERGIRLAKAVDAAAALLRLDSRTVWEANGPYIEQGIRVLGARASAIQNAGRMMSLDEARAYALEEPETSSMPRHGLTRRELQVAQLVRTGLTDRQIAERLFISRRTAESHVENLRNKLGVGTRAEVAAWVAENQLEET